LRQNPPEAWASATAASRSWTSRSVSTRSTVSPARRNPNTAPCGTGRSLCTTVAPWSAARNSGSDKIQDRAHGQVRRRVQMHQASRGRVLPARRGVAHPLEVPLVRVAQRVPTKQCLVGPQPQRQREVKARASQRLSGDPASSGTGNAYGCGLRLHRNKTSSSLPRCTTPSLGPPARDVCQLLTDRHDHVLRRPTRHATTMLDRRAPGKFGPRPSIGELVPVSRTLQHYDRFRASSTARPVPHRLRRRSLTPRNRPPGRARCVQTSRMTHRCFRSRDPDV